ncbi:hypothetical protein RB195_014830 [Necator americanus]|uniref:Copper/zinc superoxide dismutase n=1 Tax=Necator americanus TaxID=51031 RepID=A0ABR1E1U3_NECAM
MMEMGFWHKGGREEWPGEVAESRGCRQSGRQICDEHREGECAANPPDNATMLPCLCDSDCSSALKCCHHPKGLTCQAPVSPSSSTTLVCGINEQFSACHTPCQPSCDDPTLLPCPPPICTPGCHCQPGFIRADGSSRSACVPRAACAMYDMSTRCLDERRQYHSCGSACPISCSTRNSPRCILPSQCPLLTATVRQNPSNSMTVVADVNKEWLQKNLAGFYSTPGAPTILPHTSHCSDPLKNYLNCGTKCPDHLLWWLEMHETKTSQYHLDNSMILEDSSSLDSSKDPMDPSSRCVLPSECERKCNDPLKEFVVCGSSCPVACNNRRPQSCTPCESGCFCKNGLVFLNSTDWRNSDCVRLEECPDFTEETTGSAATTVPHSTESSYTEEHGLILSRKQDIGFSPKCPGTTVDVGGRSCSEDSDCPAEQRCCRPLIVSLGVNPQRCTCADPHAVWSACGSLCPEYCGQPGVPHCSTTCNAGCHCAPGYVKSGNDVTAPCVPREKCSNHTTATNDEPHATIKEIPFTPKNPFTDQQLATANLVPAKKSVSGRFSFVQISANNLRISGVLSGLPPGEHAVLIHQFGDLADGCSRLGPPFLFRGGMGTPSLGDVVADESSSASFTRVVDWPIAEVIGRSIAIYRFSTAEYSLQVKDEGPLACGTIGLTAFS